MASECANEQGAFWPYHDAIFLNRDGENVGTFTDGFLLSIAQALDLDEAEFELCLRAERHEEVILGDFQDGATRGVNSTPTIFINGQMLRGLRSFEEYQQAIEAELEAVEAE